MSKNKDLIEFEGTISEVLPNQMFKVDLDDMKKTITAYTGGKMRQFKIRIVQGDRVKVEMSPYDLEKGRITFRLQPHTIDIFLELSYNTCMIVSFQRGSKQKRADIESLSRFVAHKLMPRMAPKLSVDFCFVTNLFKREGVFGDVAYYENYGAPRDFVIRLDPSIDEIDLLKTAAHEMVHVKQIARGELKELARSPYFRFHRNYFHKSTDYFDKPWEIEAHGREEGLVVRWLEQRNHLKLS